MSLFGKLRIGLLTCLLLIVVSVACGGATAEVVTSTPTQEPTAEAGPAGVSPTSTREAILTPSPTPAILPTEKPDPAVATPVTTDPVVVIGDANFAVEPAVTPEQRSQGLSGWSGLTQGAGMLFIFESEGQHTFWMKDMRFPLDLVWISAQCAVADITEDAPPPEPGQTLADLPRYMPTEPAQYVLEINAGEAESANISIGDPVKFAGSLAGVYGC